MKDGERVDATFLQPFLSYTWPIPRRADRSGACASR